MQLIWHIHHTQLLISTFLFTELACSGVAAREKHETPVLHSLTRVGRQARLLKKVKSCSFVMQALQKDAPGNLSASTSRTGTRKRKLVEPVTAAATANLIATAGDANCTDAAEQASTVSLQQERSLGISDTTPTEGVTAAAQAAGDSQVCANPKRRTSRRNAVKSEQVQTPAGTAAAAAAAIGANGTVGESNKSTDNVDRTQAQAQSHTDNEQTGQQHTALPQAAAASAGRTRARAGSVTHGDASPVPTQEAVKSEEAIPVLDRQSDAEQSIAGNNRGERAESDRDKRLSARQQRVAAKPKSRLGTGQPCWPIQSCCVLHLIISICATLNCGLVQSPVIRHHSHCPAPSVCLFGKKLSCMFCTLSLMPTWKLLLQQLMSTCLCYSCAFQLNT